MTSKPEGIRMTTIRIPTGTTKAADSSAVSVSRAATACLASAAVSAALLVGASLLASVPAQAGPMFPLAPACDKYQFNSGLLQLDLDAGATVQIPVNGQTAAGTASVYDPTAASSGIASGGVTGRKIDITVNWTRGPAAGRQSWFSGQVNDDGRASGFSMVNTDGPSGWHTNDSLSCITPPAPPRPPAPPPMPKLPKPPPPKPLAGPGVSWDPRLGGLTVHITDRSGVDSNCTYKADAYEQGFFLPKNSTKDLVIVPAIPKFANWDVTVTCDNGTSTRTSIFF